MGHSRRVVTDVAGCSKEGDWWLGLLGLSSAELRAPMEGVLTNGCIICWAAGRLTLVIAEEC